MVTNPGIERLQHILRRGVSEVIVEQELLSRLQEDRPLRLKFGLDPNKPDIHLGHSVPLRKLRHVLFDQLGHVLVARVSAEERIGTFRHSGILSLHDTGAGTAHPPNPDVLRLIAGGT